MTNRRRQTLTTIAVLILIASFFDTIRTPIIHKTIGLITEKQDELKNIFSKVEIQGRAAYVYDVNEKTVLYKKNENFPMALASITKLMTAAVALDSVPEKTIVTINAESLKEEGDSGLFVGEKWKFKNLVQFTLVTSSNDGAKAVSIATKPFLIKQKIESINKSKATVSDSIETENKDIFIEAMNQKAKSLGLLSMEFSNPTGLDVGDSNGGYGSAKDVAMLTEYLIKKHAELMEPTSYAETGISSIGKAHTAINTNKSVDNIPGILFSKTGFTDIAGGNLTVAYDAGINHPIIITVLGSTQDGRFDDVKKLINLSRKTLEISSK